MSVEIRQVLQIRRVDIILNLGFLRFMYEPNAKNKAKDERKRKDKPWVLRVSRIYVAS